MRAAQHADGDGPLEAQGDTEFGQVVDAVAARTRTLGGIPLCNRLGAVSTIERIAPARLHGDVRVDFVGVRRTRYRRADAGLDEPETLAPSMEGTLAREAFTAPEGFTVDVACEDKPRIVEVAFEYTFTSGHGGVIDGVRVDYRDERGRPRWFVARQTLVGCGSGALPPRFQQICEDRAGADD